MITNNYVFDAKNHVLNLCPEDYREKNKRKMVKMFDRDLSEKYIDVLVNSALRIKDDSHILSEYSSWIVFLRERLDICADSDFEDVILSFEKITQQFRYNGDKLWSIQNPSRPRSKGFSNNSKTTLLKDTLNYVVCHYDCFKQPTIRDYLIVLQLNGLNHTSWYYQVDPHGELYYRIMVPLEREDELSIYDVLIQFGEMLYYSLSRTNPKLCKDIAKYYNKSIYPEQLFTELFASSVMVGMNIDAIPYKNITPNMIYCFKTSIEKYL